MNRDWFGKNNIPSVARDGVFPKLVKVIRGKVIFPGKKITSQINPQNKCVGNFTQQYQIFLSNLDYFWENIIPNCTQDIVFMKPVLVPLGKVIFLDKIRFIKGLGAYQSHMDSLFVNSKNVYKKFFM